MGRAVSPALSDFYTEAHRAFGARLFLGVGVQAIQGRGEGGGGRRSPTARSSRPISSSSASASRAEDALAREAGLACANGVVVDAHLADLRPGHLRDRRLRRSSPTRRSAFRPGSNSIQNAVDQAKCVAARLAGKPAPYDALAWFWSDQGDLKLLIAGLSHDVDQWVVRGDPATRAFSVFGFRGGKLAVVESVNRAGDHAAAKRIFATAKTMTPDRPPTRASTSGRWRRGSEPGRPDRPVQDFLSTGR